jgi:hypothetical protein
VTVKEFYDVIIVGTSFAPLAAGALLSRRGLRVLVVGNGELPQEGASLLFNTLTSSLVTRIFEELGVTHMVKRKIRRPEPLYQVILPSARIDVVASPERLGDEMHREFPRIVQDINLLLSVFPELMEGMERVLQGEHVLPPEGIIGRKRIELTMAGTPFKTGDREFDYYEKVLSDQGFSLFLKATAASHCLLDPANLSPQMGLFLHGRKVQGCAIFEGGMKALRQILCDRIDAYGGEVRGGDVIEEISLQGRRVATVRLAGKEALLGCDFLLSGIESEVLTSMLTMDGRAVRKDLLLGGDLVPTGMLATADLKVAREAIPEAMASNIIVVFDALRPLRESNYLWAEIDRGRDRERKEFRRLSLHYILDREGLAAGPSYSRGVLDEILGNLGSVMPFLERFVIECSDPVENIMKSHFTEDPLLHISRLMPSVYEYRGAGSGPFLGLGHRTEVKNIYRVNSEVCPSLGEDGLWLAALGAARIVASQRKGKTRMRRRIMFS